MKKTNKILCVCFSFKENLFKTFTQKIIAVAYGLLHLIQDIPKYFLNKNYLGTSKINK